MARRLPSHKRKKYTIIWSDKLAGHVVSREVFNRALASGWIIRTADDAAVVAHGVKAALHAGALCLEDMARKAMIWIYTSWISIDRDSPVIQGEHWEREIVKQYGNIKSHRVEPDGTWIERCDWKASL